MTEAAAFETPDDAGKGEPGEVRLWLEAIHLARKTEEVWVKKATEAVERYRDEKERRGRRFNVLFANTQTVLPAIYNSTPTPDIRRRFGDDDPIGKIVSQVLERAVSYLADEYDFDHAMRAACWDMEVAGRGAVRVRYDPTLTVDGDEEQITDEAVTCEYVAWRDFIRGPGRRWSEVPWVAFEHRLTREELRERFGAIGGTMPLDFVMDGAKKDDPRDVPEVFKRGTVYEVWNKAKREVLFVAQSVPEKVLQRTPDPLALKQFFPVPRPLYSILDTGSLVPLVPYELYRDQAEELDRVTARITALINMVKWRGLRAADLGELARLAEAEDGDFLPVQDWQQFAGATGGGGLEKALWLAPIDVLVGVIQQLVAHREEIKRVIYEITGLSDILRGASEANETATAQRLKSQWGSLRIEDRQAEVQRFARDLIRLKAEIVAEKFQPQTLAAMTGTELPTAEMKAQAQQAVMMAQQAQQEPPPGVAEMLQTPSWDDVIQVMRSDAMRSYRVDIETDSTIQADVARAQENAARFVEGFGAFVQAVGPAVQAQVMPLDVVADLLTGFARNFKLGRQAEDALDRLKNQPPPQQPDPAAGEQARMQAEEQRAQMEAQMRQAEMQQKAQIEQAKLQASVETERMKLEAQTTLERERMDREDQRHALTAQADRERFVAEAQLRMAEGDRSVGIEREKLAAAERQSSEAARAKAEPQQAVAGQIQALAEGVQAIGDGVAQIGERVAAVEAAVVELAQDVNAPVEAVRGADGRIAQVKRGKRVMNVARGADGKAMGLQ
jgi:hypothetical protein